MVRDSVNASCTRSARVAYRKMHGCHYIEDVSLAAHPGMNAGQQQHMLDDSVLTSKRWQRNLKSLGKGLISSQERRERRRETHLV